MTSWMSSRDEDRPDGTGLPVAIVVAGDVEVVLEVVEVGFGSGLSLGLFLLLSPWSSSQSIRWQTLAPVVVVLADTSQLTSSMLLVVMHEVDTGPLLSPYKLSNVYFLQWQKLAAGSNKIKNLKYFIRKNVQNPDTLRIIDEAAGSVAKEWPGTTFSMESDEGKALLRTANGVGVAYMLIQHKPELGVKVPT